MAGPSVAHYELADLELQQCAQLVSVLRLQLKQVKNSNEANPPCIKVVCAACKAQLR
jgi:hypothetical protein